MSGSVFFLDEKTVACKLRFRQLTGPHSAGVKKRSKPRKCVVEAARPLFYPRSFVRSSDRALFYKSRSQTPTTEIQTRNAARCGFA